MEIKVKEGCHPLCANKVTVLIQTAKPLENIQCPKRLRRTKHQYSSIFPQGKSSPLAGLLLSSTKHLGRNNSTVKISKREENRRSITTAFIQKFNTSI